MPQAPKPLTPHLSARHRFGAELRASRVERGLSQAELARLVHVHPDLIAKVEKALRWPTYELVIACDAALDGNGTLRDLWPAVTSERGRLRTRALGASEVAEVDLPAGLEPIDQVANRLWSRVCCTDR